MKASSYPLQVTLLYAVVRIRSLSRWYTDSVRRDCGCHISPSVHGFAGADHTISDFTDARESFSVYPCSRCMPYTWPPDLLG